MTDEEWDALLEVRGDRRTIGRCGSMISFHFIVG